MRLYQSGQEALYMQARFKNTMRNIHGVFSYFWLENRMDIAPIYFNLYLLPETAA
jgi:hypothetical protein